MANCGTEDCDNDHGNVGVLLNNGDGTFQTAVTYDSGGILAGSAAVEDVNGDGKVDLLVANACGNPKCIGSVGVFLGNGDGTFQAVVTFGSGGRGAYSVAAADVNGDNKLDLLVANSVISCGGKRCTHGSVGVLINAGGVGPIYSDQQPALIQSGSDLVSH